MAHSNAIVIDALSNLADKNNWEIKTEYGPYGSYVVYVWTNTYYTPFDLAEEALEALEQE